MFMFAYLVGGWVQANAYVSKTCMNLLKSKNADFEIQGITGYSMNFWENDNHSVWKIAFFIHLFSDDTYLCLGKTKRVRILSKKHADYDGSTIGTDATEAPDPAFLDWREDI